MILALIDFAKTSLNSEKESARTILYKVLETLDLHTYEKIQMVTKAKCSNDTIANCTIDINLSEEDVRMLGLLSMI